MIRDYDVISTTAKLVCTESLQLEISRTLLNVGTGMRWLIIAASRSRWWSIDETRKPPWSIDRLVVALTTTTGLRRI